MKKKKKIIIIVVLLVLVAVYHPRRLCAYQASDIGKVRIFSLFYGRIMEYEDEESIAYYVNNWRSTWYIPTYIPIAGGSGSYQLTLYDKNGEELDEQPIIISKNWHQIIVVDNTCMEEIHQQFDELMETEK